MWPILVEKYPILTNNRIIGRKFSLLGFPWELFLFLKLGCQWENSLFCHISPEVSTFLSFGISVWNSFHLVGILLEFDIFIESFNISFSESLGGIWYFSKFPPLFTKLNVSNIFLIFLSNFSWCGISLSGEQVERLQIVCHHFPITPPSNRRLFQIFHNSIFSLSFSSHFQPPTPGQ